MMKGRFKGRTRHFMCQCYYVTSTKENTIARHRT